MTFKLYYDIKEFYQDTFDILMRHEAQNIIPLGNVIMGNEGKNKHEWRDPANWLMATVMDENIRLIAIMTPPFHLTLYATDNKFDASVINCLVTGLAETDFTINSVMTEKSLSEAFVKAYKKGKDISCEVEMEQRIFELEEVSKDIDRIGQLRLATENDMTFVPYWKEAFDSECFDSPLVIANDISKYSYYIENKLLYILEDNNIPVSMVGSFLKTDNLCAISCVYTPPYHRRKGFASASVAKLSEKILAEGFKKCVLYTDLANPTSNSIYQKIGYKPVCDSTVVQFT